MTGKTSPKLAAIWAQDRHGVLGSGTQMLWHVPADFAHFKRSTLGCPVIMGRRSWEALGAPLPGRTNIVITSTPGYVAEGAVLASCIDEALRIGRSAAIDMGADTMWITGGARVYADTLHHVDEIVVTDLDIDVAASHPDAPLVYAPAIEAEVWKVDTARSDSTWREVSGDAPWRVTTYVRR